MTVYPHCKINIGLNVVAKRPDGYHDLETIFYPVPLCDRLTAEEAAEDSLTIEGVQLDGDWQDNLVMKALYTLRNQGYAIPPQRITLEKNIPCGAGLGGGSSDAAFMMKTMNETYRLGLSDNDMEKLLAPLGADCPFFVKGKPIFAEGIGNIFSPIDLSLKGWTLLLIKPNDHISTKEAYAGVKPCKPAFSLTGIGLIPVNEWDGRVVNDFEKSVFTTHPNVARIKQDLYKMGAEYAAMSGSGSSVFGLFREEPPTNEKDFASCFTFRTKL